jgi:putative ABC transport system substrate-binding protein
MRRRDFISLLGGAAAVWSLAASAQQRERLRRIGVLLPNVDSDPYGLEAITAFAQGLAELGWSVGRNVRLDYRWGAVDAERRRRYAEELVALAPDVVLTASGSIVGALQQASRTVPIVFVTTIDPVGGGYVQSLAHPGGNATGFMSTEFITAGKWLELLKQIAPSVTRVAVIRDPAVPAGTGRFAAIQTVAPSFRVELSAIGVYDAIEIERGIASFAHGANGGLIVAGPPSSMEPHRNLVVGLAAQHRLPAVYSEHFSVAAGGLASYGIDSLDQYRRAAGYVDRILRGEKPADLPVQTPTKFNLAINMKTAKMLGLTVPPTLLASADEVIE